MKIKEWKVNEIKRTTGGFLVSVDGIERETEKAYLLYITVGYSSDIERMTTVWCPKSATMTDEEAEAEAEKEAFYKKCDDGLAYNKSLVEFAKKNGVKGIRTGLRTVTITNKIIAAGLEVPARA